MEVLKTAKITEEAAATILKKFVETKEDETNADLMVRRGFNGVVGCVYVAKKESVWLTEENCVPMQMSEEVKFQLLQVLAYLEGKTPQIELPQTENLYGQY